MLKIETIPIGTIKQNARNPRRNAEAIEPVARSIQTYGFLSPLICDEDLNLAAGHTRLEAARRLGLTEVPVIRVPGLVGSKFTGFAIADNKTAEIAEWDKDLLAQIVSELNLDVDFDLGSLGFDDKELTEILDWNVDEEEDKEDEAPPLPETPITQPGDLYILGDHRLLCGDATQREDVLRLTEGNRIDCILTDPPYGVSYMSRGQNREQWGGIKNDDLDPGSLEILLRQSFTNLASVCRPGATAYICHALGLAGVRIAFERAFLDAGFALSATITWVKQSASMGWGDYRHASEPLLYGWIGEGHRKIKDRTQTTVWQIDRESSLRHPTQKPVALFSRALRNSTIRGENVADVFVGSGTTMIACEQHGRRCFAMEIEPKYCDVVVERWQTYTRRTAEQIRPPAPAAEEVIRRDVPTADN
jgi:site-specific DNA-methyltransferase (adenine-specific)